MIYLVVYDLPTFLLHYYYYYYFVFAPIPKTIQAVISKNNRQTFSLVYNKDLYRNVVIIIILSCIVSSLQSKRDVYRNTIYKHF